MMMDESVNFAKGGYTKINPSDHNPNLPHRPIKLAQSRRTTVIFSSILLLSVVFGAAIAAFIYHSTSEPPDQSASSSPSLASKPNESIKSVCTVTQYPDSCFTTISAAAATTTTTKPDPEHIFELSLQVAIDELRNLSSLPQTLVSKSNDQGTESALRDCATLLTDSLSQLNNSVESMRVGVGEKALTEDKINDMKTWISAAMSGEETCLDGLEEMGSTVLDEVKVKVQRSKEYMSNSLAILSNIHPLLENFGLTLH